MKNKNNFSFESSYCNEMYFTTRDHSSITSSKRWVGGWGQKIAIFDDLQYCKSSKRWVGGPKKVKNMMM